MNKDSLNNYSKKIFSQFGEDGIILEILNRLTKKNLDFWCVEFGARDGISDSNTLNLIKNYEYKAVLIEGDKKYFKKLCKNFPQDEIIKINRLVSFDGQNKLDNLLKNTKIPKNFDFLSIDIDGCDYYIFESLSEYRPKLLSIEFNQLIPNAIEFVQKKDFKIKQGSSARSLVNLAKKKNYELVASTLTNLFFVDKSYSDLISKTPINLDDLIDDREIQNYILKCSKNMHVNDIYFFNDYRFLFQELESNDIILTPHFYPSSPITKQNWLEANFRVGLYNAGFLGINKSAKEALEWWADCCLYEMKKSYFRGLFDDQKYLDLFPILFNRVKILKHRGCNLAGWNDNIQLKQTEVIFIHFSPFTISKFKNKTNYYHPLYLQYIKQLRTHNLNYKPKNKPINLLFIQNGFYYLRWKLARFLN